MALFDAEGELLKQLRQKGILVNGSSRNKYTRFVDDLTFSGEAGSEQEFIATAIAVFKRYGFEINREKLENGIQRKGARQSVCGANVSSDHATLSRDYIQNLRAAIWQIEQAPLGDVSEKEIASLEGKARWVKRFRPEKGKDFLHRIEEVKRQRQRILP